MTVGHPETTDRVSFEIELDEHDRLVADDPSVVFRLDRDDLRGLAFHAAAIRVFDVNPSASEEADMRVHAVVGADDRFHVDRPPESRRIDHAFHTRLAGLPCLHTNMSDVASDDVLERSEKSVT